MKSKNYARICRDTNVRMAETARIDRAYNEGTRTPAVIAQYVAHHKCSWPGGYELITLADDGGYICNRCCGTEAARIAEATPGDGFYLTAVFSLETEDGNDTSCDHCGRAILKGK